MVSGVTETMSQTWKEGQPRKFTPWGQLEELGERSILTVILLSSELQFIPHFTFFQRALTWNLGFNNMIMLTQILLSRRMWKEKIALLLSLAISLPSHIPHVWFHFPSTPDAKYYLELLKKKIMEYSVKVVGETFERTFAFLASFNTLTIRKRKGRFSLCPVEGQPFPHTWSPKGVLIGHFFLQWLLEVHPELSPPRPMTFLMQEENNVGTPLSMGKPTGHHWMPKDSTKILAPWKHFCSTA